MSTISAFRMKLKPGQVDEYRRRHDAIWPELAKAISAAGIYDYSIFLDEETLALFAVMKLRDDNSQDELPDQPVMLWRPLSDQLNIDFIPASGSNLPVSLVFYRARPQLGQGGGLKTYQP